MKKKIGLIICLLIVLMSAGCWNKKEPKDLAIVNSIIYNKTQDGTYEVTVEILDLTGSGKKSVTGGGGGGGSSGKNFVTETAKGSSYREAVANVSSSVEKTMYGGHNHVRFFTESAAKEDMAATIDYLLRDHLTDETPLMVVIKGDHPEKIYEASMGLSDSLGVYIDRMQVTQQKLSSKAVYVTTLNFMRDFFNDGKQPVAGVIQVVKSQPDKQKTEGSSEGGDNKEHVLYEGLAAFKGDKLVGFLDGSETSAYNFITGKIGMAIITVPFKNSYVVCEVTSASSDIKTKIDGDTAAIDVKIMANIRVTGCGADEDPSNPEIMKQIETAFNNDLLPQIAAVIEKAQKEFGSDIFGFGMSVHAQNPEEWKRIRKQWDQLFPTVTVSISVESNVYQTGETKDSVLSEFSED